MNLWHFKINLELTVHFPRPTNKNMEIHMHPSFRYHNIYYMSRFISSIILFQQILECSELLFLMNWLKLSWTNNLPQFFIFYFLDISEDMEKSENDCSKSFFFLRQTYL